jgi:uncharacterized protein
VGLLAPLLWDENLCTAAKDLGVKAYLKDRFDSLSRIAAVRAPLLVMQDGRDRVIPLQSGRELFAAAPEPKEIWIAPEGGHNDLARFGALTTAIDFIRRRTPVG